MIQECENSIVEDDFHGFSHRNCEGTEQLQKIVEKCGQAGYVAVDSENHVNMTCTDKLLKFISKQEADENSKIKVIQVSYYGGFSLYDLSTNNGIVRVKQNYYQYRNNQLIETGNFEFEADVFDFTDEGYLMIEGFWHSPEQYVLTLSEEEQHIALRVNDNGSLTLLVYAVFPNDNTSKQFAHEVTIKDENGKIYYLSNHILEDQELNLWWHADRYTDDEWKDYYGGMIDNEKLKMAHKKIWYWAGCDSYCNFACKKDASSRKAAGNMGAADRKSGNQ